MPSSNAHHAVIAYRNHKVFVRQKAPHRCGLKHSFRIKNHHYIPKLQSVNSDLRSTWSEHLSSIYEACTALVCLSAVIFTRLSDYAIEIPSWTLI
jgi:hypothetical protein